MKYPDVAAWDLDYTVWPCFCDTHIYPPLSPIASDDGQVLEIVDSHGYRVSLYPEIPHIMIALKNNGVRQLSASRTWSPEIAIQMLKLFKISINGELTDLFSIFDDLNWGDHSKINHIRSGIKNIYGKDNLRNLDVCLFDDETRNKDVEKFGIKYLHVKDPDSGPTWNLFNSYLESLNDK